jgi:hypothetical protein
MFALFTRVLHYWGATKSFNVIVQETYPICLLSHGFLLGQGLEIFKGRVQPELTIN